MALDLDSFSSLVKSIVKVEASRDTRNARTMLIAACQDQKAMKEHTKQFGAG